MSSVSGISKPRAVALGAYGSPPRMDRFWAFRDNSVIRTRARRVLHEGLPGVGATLRLPRRQIIRAALSGGQVVASGRGNSNLLPFGANRAMTKRHGRS